MDEVDTVLGAWLALPDVRSIDETCAALVTLLLKIGLFAGMGALALANRFWITPGLKRGGDPAIWLPRLRRQVMAEFALGIGVLAVVGALGAMSPPVSG